MGGRVYAEVYGCSANQADGEMALGLLKTSGYELVSSPDKADYVVLVTCAVKKPTADRMIHRVKRFSKMGGRLVVAGCMASGEAERVRRAAPEAVLVPPKQVVGIVDFIQGRAVEGRWIKAGLPRVRRNPVVAIIPVSEGCRWSKCSFCIVPNTRPGYESYPVRMIVDEVRRSLLEGCREVWLTSQDMGSYGTESGRNLLPQLLEAVNNVEGRFYVRVGMMNPIYLNPILNQLVDAYLGAKMFKFLHLPVQSGSDKVLKHMNRGHTSQMFLRIVEKFREKIPETTLATDIIVGYPTEEGEDFEQTLKLVERVKPSVVNISRYFPRPDTPAENLKQLKPEVVARRVAALKQLVEEVQLENNERWLGWYGPALVDEVGKNGLMVARNHAYRPIVLDTRKNLLGQFVEVEVVGAEKTYLRGRLM
ncbi:MAG: tRNA (N(6)-L-threonylcarbamoyladenosine(37)-C(2))-methylthiotransferase [Candidatus Caldarchaeum sp.]|nr:tRNA (N(6)-L-threonylcarbamoyladenosine(37)-C(2))-methylthiotransferase [Candidatus Caldarchaeum sp.]MCS7137386.1 tRNA (N(6)-L-threonylcarbamoyladenosine(37)-C(2))-methylthiotransferase [Candidatus Caldarchaeum sp.]MDW8359239.1 tRNA (N(6)-L-threonylcarbamoyladenosine(37)-C(2))-methylthiotransferase [Candidatus Caldarchaeum sp.]